MFKDGGSWTGNGKGKSRSLEKPRLTAASVIRSPRYYGHFFWPPGKNRHTFSCQKKPSLIRPNFLAHWWPLLRDSTVLPNSEWVMSWGFFSFFIFLFPDLVSLVTSHGSRSRGVLNKCLYGEAPPPPRSNPLPFYVPFFTKKSTAFLYLV